jgi:hypothetical protein
LDEESGMKLIGFIGMAAVLAGSLAGCGWSRFQSGGDSQGYWLPLTVLVRFDSSVTGATVTYIDACQQPKAISAGAQLTHVLRRELGLAFERVRVEGTDPGQAVDGELEFSLGLKDIGLAIPRKADKSHLATVHLGGTVVFRDQAGVVLYTKSLRTDFEGEVQTTRGSCEVSGLAEVVNDAGLILAQGVKKHLGTSVKIQQYAGQRAAARR